MEGVVDAVKDQLDVVRAKIAAIQEKQALLKLLDEELKRERASERRLALALSKLRGETSSPRKRRRSEDNARAVRSFLLSQGAPVTLSQIARATDLPLSSVRNAILRMADTVQGPGRVWEVAK